MNDISVEKTGGDAASAALKVTVPVDRVQAAEAKVIRSYSRQARLPGFRKGHAPEAVVRKRFGEAIRQGVLEAVIRESWDTAKERESLQPIADPSIRNLKFEDGSPIEFELVVPVQPAVTLGREGGFRLNRVVAPVTDEQVDEQLQRLREQKATWRPVEGAAPAPGQMARIEVTTLGEGADAEPQSYDLVLGQGRAVPALEEAVMSLKPGESRETDIRFADDHPDAARRGQSRKVRVAVQEVKVQDLPTLDDAFAREAGDFETVAALRAAVRDDLAADARREADARLRDELIRQLAEANQVPAPESLVHRVLHGYASAYGIPEEQLPTFEAQFRPIAEAQVRRDLILDAAVKTHGLRATEAEIDERVARLAGARGMEPGQLYASLQKHNRLTELEHAVTEAKVFTHLLAQSTVDEA